MSDLQNRLDQYREPDFDQEALWDKIERPEKKRRRWILFLWLGLLMSFSMAGAYWLDSIDFISEKEPVDLDSYIIQISEKASEDKMNWEDITIENEEENKGNGSSVIALIKNDAGNSTADIQTVQPRTFDAEPIHTDHIKQRQEKHRQSLYNENETSIQIEASPSLPSTMQELEKLPTISMVLMDIDYPKEPLPKISSISECVIAFPRHELMFFGGLAGQLHRFHVEDGKKTKLEKTIPGYYLGLQYKKRFNNVYYLVADAKYAFHQSEIDATDKQSLQLLSSTNEVTVIETTTHYSLYNQYHYLDLAIGAGIAQYIGNMEIVLESSLGAAHWLKVDADYLDENTVLQKVKSNEIKPTTIFGKLNFSLRRHLPTNILIGGNISAQTPLRVDSKSATFRHQLLPFYIGINIGKRF
ncbi:MAG: hypothetical protein MI974_33725 [Chitinophagales bacterium]|nr:hypothetical protein [Chitinophagales bacterium]